MPGFTFTRHLSSKTLSAFRWDTRSGLLTGVFQGMTLPFFGVLARRMHASNLEMSLLMAAPFLGHLLSMFVAWHMQNRPKKPYVFWLGMLARAPLLLMAFATHSRDFIAIVIISQLISCFVTPAYAAIMKDVYPDNYRGRLMGMVRVWLTLAAMLAGLVTGQLMEYGLPAGWVMALALIAAAYLAFELQMGVRGVLAALLALAVGYLAIPWLGHPVAYPVIFPVAGAIGMLAWWMFDHLHESPAADLPEKQFNVLEGVMTLVTDRRFGLYSLAFFTFGFGNFLQSPLIPLLQVDELHITDQWVGILAMIGAGMSALFYAIWGRLMDRANPFHTAVFSFAVWGLTPIVYALAHTVPTLIVAAVLIGIASPGVDLAWLNAVMQFTNREGIPRYAATHTFLVGIRGLVGPFVGVWLLKTFPLRHCFYISAGIIWVGIVMMAAVVWFVLLPSMKPAAQPELVA